MTPETSFKPVYFYAKFSIKIDTPKCLKITVVILVYISLYPFKNGKSGNLDFY